MNERKRIGKRTLTADEERDAVLAAVASLRSPSRATLDLIYREGYSMHEVAGISGMDAASIERWRITALTELAEELGSADPETAGAMLERALGDREPEPVEPEPPPRAPAGRADTAPNKKSASRLAGFAILSVAFVIALIAITAGGDDESPESPPSATPSPATPAEPQTQGISLEPLPGAPNRGSVSTLPRDPRSTQLVLKLSGLPEPDGRYEAWLYSSVLNSESLGSIDKGDGSIEATLPPDAGDYEFLDVSIQPKQEGPHSGQSVVRVPLEEVLGR